MRRMSAAVAALGLVVAGCSGASGGDATSAPEVHTTAGSVRGTEDAAVHRFQGLPYAQPPVGQLRWTAPRPPRAWPGVRSADKPGNRCPQAADSPGGQPSTTEDCLYLNVTTPAKAGSKRPVMVWLHGGDGTGAGADYDPARMVEQGDVDVVTVNYRIGAFGNFALPQLGSSEAFGTQDQLAALRWVKQNAAAFGGDPGNVTVFGESSGAFATCALLSSPQAKGLVQHAIMESSSCSAYFPKNALAPGLGRHTLFTPLAQAQAAGTAAARKFGCTGADPLACLRRVPARAWLDGGYTEIFTATPYGTPVLPASPETAMRDGRTLDIPVLFGTNRDELRLYLAASLATGTKFDEPTYQHLLADTYGSSAAEIAATYSAQGTDPLAPALAWSAATTDDGWGCPTAADAQALTAAGRTAYTYLFADEQAPPIPGYLVPPGFPLGAAHGLEMGYLFWAARGTPAQRELSTTMIGYWTNFARTGDPNGPGLPPWPKFATGAKVQRLAPDRITQVDPQATFKCELWRGAGQ